MSKNRKNLDLSEVLDIKNIEAVNKRELEMGAASMTALVWLLDKYGLK